MALRRGNLQNRYHYIEFEYVSVDHRNCKMSEYDCRTIMEYQTQTPFRSCKHAQMIILRYAQQWPHTYSIARHASVFIMDDNVKRTYYMIHEKRRCTPWNENIDLSTYFFWGTSMITNMKYFVQGLDKILLIQLL